MSEARTGRAGPYRILLAEEEPYVRRILSTLLEGPDLELEIVHDGTAAIRALRSESPYHLILLDMVMSEASGLDVLREIRTLPRRAAPRSSSARPRGRTRTGKKLSRLARTSSSLSRSAPRSC